MELIGKIYISRPMIESLQIPIQPFIKVRVGNLTVISQMKITTDSRPTYSLSDNLFSTLHIKRKPLKILYDKYENTIRLGPIIGILATSLPNRSEYDPKSTQAELIYLSNIAKKMEGYIFLFTPACVDFDKQTIRGYHYNQSPGRGFWVPAIYPMPDVVYDRISSRKSEIRFKSIREQLMQIPHLKYFNPSYLNKWDVHQILRNEASLKNNLPDTLNLTTENLSYMLNLYKVVFVKPSNGSLGHGIIRIVRTSQNQLNYTVYRKKRMKRRVYNVEEFMEKTRQIRGDKPYIVQQGLDLANYRGATFDLRIIYQKDGKGEWVISKKFVRVAAKGSNISNLSTGGTAIVSKRVLRYLFKTKDLIRIKNIEIEDLCLKIARALEKSSNQIYGELGLDIGIDKGGNPWLIEVNSKPRKTTETEFSMKIVRNTFIRPLEFAVFLAGFSKN